MTQDTRQTQPRATRSIVQLIATTGLLVMGAGCVKRLEYDADVEQPDIPPSYASAQPGDPSTTQLSDRWWTEFQSSQLSDLVDEALSRSPTLAASEARVRAAAAQARIAGADLMPQVSGGLTGGRRKQNFIGLPIPGVEGGILSTTSSTLGLSLNLSWEIDLWGRIRDQDASARADYQATATEYRGAQLSLAGQVSKAYIALSEAEQQLELAQATRDSYQSDSEQVQSRYRKGLRPSLDYRLSQANLASAEAVVRTRLTQRDAAARTLEVLLGRYPRGSISVETPPVVPAIVPSGVPADLLRRRPDLAARERRLESALYDWSAAKKSLYPGFSLTASGGTSSSRLQDLVDGDFRVWSLAASLLQPIFQGGKLRASVELAAAGIDANTADFVAAALRGFAEVEGALGAETHLRDRVDHLRNAAGQSVEAQNLAQERYRSGLAIYATVLESQRRAFQAQGELITAKRQLLENRIDLYLALGGGFNESETATQLAVKGN